MAKNDSIRSNTEFSRFADNREAPLPSSVARKKLDADIARFLAAGGKVTKVKTGVSGYVPTSQFVIDPRKGRDKRIKK